MQMLGYVPKAKKYIFFFLILWLALMFRSQAQWLWVDPDYHYAMIALSNHWSPDVRDGDVTAMQELAGLELSQIYLPPYGHFEVNDKYYGGHFWFWSLLCVPAFKLLPIIGINPLRAHEITFFVIFAVSLLVACKYLALSDNRKTCFFLLVTISPILWLTNIMGSEALLYSCMIIAVSFVSQKRYDLAALAVSIASLQNTAYVPLAVLMAFLYLMNCKINISTVSRIILCLSPLLISPVFYLMLISHWNPIAKFTVQPKIQNLNLNMFLLLLFDFNQGLILYTPLLVLSYTLILPYQVIKSLTPKKIDFFLRDDNAIILIPLIISLIISLMVNWNCGRWGANRYALPLIPFMAYIVCKLRIKYFSAIVIGNLLIMLSWFAFSSAGVINYRGAHYTDFNAVSRLILRYVPSLYPAYSDETFVEPIINRDFLGNPFIASEPEYDLLPVIYFDSKYGARKILATQRNIQDLERYFYFEKNETLDYIKRKSLGKKDPFYINLPAFYRSGEIYLKPLMTSGNDVSWNIEALYFKDKSSSGQQIINFTLRLHNLSDNVFPCIPAKLPLNNSLTLRWFVAKTLSSEKNDKIILGQTPLEKSIHPSEYSDFNLSFDTRELVPGKYHLFADMVQGDVGNLYQGDNKSLFDFEVPPPSE